MRILLRYARLLDTTFYMEPCDVLLDEDRISAVLRDRMARQNADLVLDLRGCTIVPGFVDTDLSCRSPEELADRPMPSKRRYLGPLRLSSRPRASGRPSRALCPCSGRERSRFYPISRRNGPGRRREAQPLSSP